MIRLCCSKCGLQVRHKEAGLFIKDGWRHYGDVAYCPRCTKVVSNIITDPNSMAWYLLHRLSSEIIELESTIKCCEKEIDKLKKENGIY